MWVGGLGFSIMFNLKERKKQYVADEVQQRLDSGAFGEYLQASFNSN